MAKKPLPRRTRQDVLNELYWHKLAKAAHYLERHTHLVLSSKNSNFPREQRYYLCKHINDSVDRILTWVIRVKKGYHTRSTLQSIDIEVDKLRYRIHESIELRYITRKRGHYWGKRANVVGSIVGEMLKKDN